MNLLPYPRTLRRRAGVCQIPANPVLLMDGALDRQTELLPIAGRIRQVFQDRGSELELCLGSQHRRFAILAEPQDFKGNRAETYRLEIKKHGILIEYQEVGGLRAAVATLRQLVREHGLRLPCLLIDDYPDFPNRGVMLDISRGRVPRLSTLLQLADHLADFKINELQLYTEHTFAYCNYEPVWRDWGALTAGEILELDAHCRRLGINLVPNQNSFGHLRYFLEHPRLKKLAEVSEPYEGANGDFLRYPTTLAPNNPGTLPFIRELFDELLPNFSSKSFNVGCDETWDLGRGQSKALCEKKGKGEVYFDFLTSIHREVNSRGRQMMFWGDIILHHPELIPKLPKNVVALNWGYEKNHPFEKETASFARSKIPFYVCPGTSTWMTLLGRHDNALLNLRSAAQAGGKHGAIGYLNTDWGDGGHPQPLAVSYLPYLFGAACAWCEKTADEKLLAPVLSRDIFCDPTGHAAAAAFALGLAHTKFSYFSPNATPFGAVIAAPPPEWRELFCRDGLKYYARIPAKNIIRALEEVRRQRLRLKKSRPIGAEAEVLVMELDLAARMASKSCEITLWQQGVAKKSSGSQELARKCIAELKALDADFKAYWPLRNKGTTRKCSAFLQWRINDFQKQKLFYPPEKARIAKPKTYAAE